jgi:nucleotide-binding universal stress UspA family protein
MTKHVLVPLDASEQARKAFEWTVEEFDDARLTLLHVISPTDPGFLPGITVEMSPDEDGYAEAVAEKYLSEFVEAAEEKGFDATGEYVTGDAPREIVRYAEENGVDHIVMGSHGRSGAARVLLGSVAENVARRSPTPVTVVR